MTTTHKYDGSTTALLSTSSYLGHELLRHPLHARVICLPLWINLPSERLDTHVYLRLQSLNLILLLFPPPYLNVHAPTEESGNCSSRYCRTLNTTNLIICHFNRFLHFYRPRRIVTAMYPYLTPYGGFPPPPYLGSIPFPSPKIHSQV